MMTSRLSRNAMLVGLNFGGLMASKTDHEISRQVAAQHNADEDAGEYKARIWPKGALAGISKVVNLARIKHYELTMPYPDKGWSLLPVQVQPKYQTIMDKLKMDWTREVDAFTDPKVYNHWLKVAQQKRQKMFDANDYPDISVVRDHFTFGVKFRPVPDGDHMSDLLDATVAETIREDLENDMKNAFEVAHRSLWERLHGGVQRLADNCRTYKSGGPDETVRFYDSVITGLRSTLDVLRDMNIRDDRILAGMIDQVEDSLLQHESDEIKTNNRLRRDLELTANDMLETLKEKGQI